MKNKYIAALLLSCAPAWATISIPHTAVQTSCSSAHSITVSSTTAGHAAVIFSNQASNVTISTATGCSAPGWVSLSAQVAGGDANTGFGDAMYCPSMNGGVTTITMTFSGTTLTGGLCGYWDISSTGTLTFGAATKNYNSVNCTSCAGATPNFNGGTNSVVVAESGCAQTCSGVTTYTSDNAFPNGNGMGHLLNTASTSPPTWTQSPTGTMECMAITFYDAGSSNPAGQFPRIE